MELAKGIELRVCDSVELLEGCVDLQRRVFALPELEISPVRHFIVTMHAGGFTLGAFDDGRLIGFCLSVPAVLGGESAFYSHMTAVEDGYQGAGIGAALKWKQRLVSLERGVKLIKWTFQPEKSRNAYFNLEKLGAEVREYMPNFYGTDYGSDLKGNTDVPLQSDRLFALWRLDSAKVIAFADKQPFSEAVEPVAEIRGVLNWNDLVSTDRAEAAREQGRLRKEFGNMFDNGLICRGFRREEARGSYLFFEK
ncbi:MAG: hypothetical protein R2684_13350 [Pyrinomonadaceae bacterium]